MLALKLTLTPLLIGAVSLAGRRWGPAISGWLVGLPLTSGPMVFFLALEQGHEFAAQTVRGTLLGLVSLAAFCLVYAWVAATSGWLASTLAGWSAYFVVTLLLNRVQTSLLVSFSAAVATLAVCLAFFPQTTAARPTTQPPRWEIPLRMVAATALVLGLTAAARTLGPQLSGLLTPFPAYATILAGFTHAFDSGAAAARLLRGVVTGTFSFALFFLVVGGVIERWGLAAAFTSAVFAALVTHGISLARIDRPRST
ncbi:MAG: hypothetical protein ACRD24_00585 [Terriglobales bacterium]